MRGGKGDVVSRGWGLGDEGGGEQRGGPPERVREFAGRVSHLPNEVAQHPRPLRAPGQRGGGGGGGAAGPAVRARRGEPDPAAVMAVASCPAGSNAASLALAHGCTHRRCVMKCPRGMYRVALALASSNGPLSLPHECELSVASNRAERNIAIFLSKIWDGSLQRGLNSPIFSRKCSRSVGLPMSIHRRRSQRFKPFVHLSFVPLTRFRWRYRTYPDLTRNLQSSISEIAPFINFLSTFVLTIEGIIKDRHENTEPSPLQFTGI